MKELSKALFQLFFLASKRPLKMTSSLLISSEYYARLFLCLIYTHATNDIIITPLDYSGYPILCYLVLELQDSFCQGWETDNFN